MLQESLLEGAITFRFGPSMLFFNMMFVLNCINKSLAVLIFLFFHLLECTLFYFQSLAVGHSEVEGISRLTTVVPGTDESISKLVQQLYKLVELREVQYIY